jgi:hypothetical protein
MVHPPVDEYARRRQLVELYRNDAGAPDCVGNELRFNFEGHNFAVGIRVAGFKRIPRRPEELNARRTDFKTGRFAEMENYPAALFSRPVGIRESRRADLRNQ